MESSDFKDKLKAAINDMKGKEAKEVLTKLMPILSSPRLSRDVETVYSAVRVSDCLLRRLAQSYCTSAIVPCLTAQAGAALLSGILCV